MHKKEANCICMEIKKNEHVQELQRGVDIRAILLNEMITADFWAGVDRVSPKRPYVILRLIINIKRVPPYGKHW